MYNPNLANFIASFLLDAELYIKKIIPTNANSYMNYSRYAISNLFIAIEMLLREIIRKNINNIIEPTGKTDLVNYFNYYCKGDIRKFKNNILTNSIPIKNLIETFTEGSSPKFFGLNSINDQVRINVLQEMREVRNRLFHEGRVSPTDFYIIEESFKIISETFEEIYNTNYKIIRYTEQIKKIPDEEPFNVIIEIYDAILKDFNALLDNSKVIENWKTYSYSKFIICYLFSIATEKLDRDFSSTLVGNYKTFANLESKIWKIYN